MNHKVTRTALFEEVWRDPISKLCKKYDISDVGLKKVLDRHRIPRPPVGFWAMKPQNQRKHLKPLPDLKSGQAEEIVFQGLTHHRTQSLAFHELVQRAKAFEPSLSKRPPSEVSRIFTDLRRQQTDKYGVVKSNNIRASKKRLTEVKQVILYLQQLTIHLGWELTVGNGIRLSMDEGSYRVELNERVRRVDNPTYGKYQETRNYRDLDRWLYTPTGTLTLSLDNKKFRVDEGIINDCGKIVEYVLETNRKRLLAAQEHRRREEEKKALRRLNGQTEFSERLKAYTAEILIETSQQHRKWTDAMEYLSYLKSQDLASFGETIELLESGLEHIKPLSPTALRNKIEKRESELQAEFQHFIDSGWWPRARYTGN